MDIQIKIIQADDEGIWCVSKASALWLPNNQLPIGRADAFGLTHYKAILIDTWQTHNVWMVIDKTMTQNMVSLRMLLEECEPELFALLGKAIQLIAFYRSHRYCGYCRHKMTWSKVEWCVHCHACKNRYYPQIAPAIIVAVRRGEHILLANHVNHRNDLYTTIAGFVEVGECLEQTVAREVYEETGIKIKNIHHMASQPWPFPHSLMVGFLAEYESGKINLCKDELKDAQWFHYQSLPKIPPKQTIARYLIEQTIKLCARNKR